jgi:dipeptidyl aminopeptidase/acylaminoacyl peptidase
MVPIEHSYDLVAAREKLGYPTTLRVFEGAPHGFLNSTKWGVADTAGDEVIQFLTR